MTDVINEAYLSSLSFKELDGEARGILGNKEYAKLMDQTATPETVIAAVLAKLQTSSAYRPHVQKNLFGVDGKTAAAGPDK